MAGIFNLFGDTLESERGHLVKPIVKSKSSLGLSGSVGKSVGLSKPKGLSIRSNSDLNVPLTPRANLKQGTSSGKQAEFLKPKLTQLDNTGRPISPSKEQSTKKVNLKKVKEPSGKSEVPSSNSLKREKLSDEVIFKKPMPPKKTMKKAMFPEPESLAPYWNLQNEFENIYSKHWDCNFSSLRQKSEVKLYEDEGFESDPEYLPSPNMPTLSVSFTHSDQEWRRGGSPELPDISDDEF